MLSRASSQVRKLLKQNHEKLTRTKHLKDIKIFNLITKKNIEYAKCVLLSWKSNASPWLLLRKLKVPQSEILKFRRWMIRYSYPWLKYCTPTAGVMIAGDIIAQKYANGYLKEYDESTRHSVDWWRTLSFGAIGFALIGPILCKWNLLMYRSLRRQSKVKFIISKLLWDVFIISPILLAAVILPYDYKYLKEKEIWKDFQLKWWTLWENRYKMPVFDILKLNLQTRPIVVLVLCFLVPRPVRRTLRGLYEVLFAAYVSERLSVGFREAARREARLQAYGGDNLEHSGLCLCVRWMSHFVTNPKQK